MHSKHFERTHGIHLQQLGLVFEGEPYCNVFEQKNNKTVAETLAHRRYAKLKSPTEKNYPNELGRPLGEFLGDLKRRGDDFYKQFLNKYGDGTYLTFRLESASHLYLKGIYAFFSKGQLMYIGRCRNSMKSRINSGYGKIDKENCYLDGQATNCRVNALIVKEGGTVSLWMYPMSDNEKIDALERQLINHYNPCWNIQKP